MITIIDDNIVLTGESVITEETQNSIIKYIVFTATSVSETSELTVTITPAWVQLEWDVSVTMVRCIRDADGKTYAIRIECQKFYVTDQSEKKRKVKIDGMVYTNNPLVKAPVHETFDLTGCVGWNA